MKLKHLRSGVAATAPTDEQIELGRSWTSLILLSAQDDKDVLLLSKQVN